MFGNQVQYQNKQKTLIQWTLINVLVMVAPLLIMAGLNQFKLLSQITPGNVGNFDLLSQLTWLMSGRLILGVILFNILNVLLGYGLKKLIPQQHTNWSQQFNLVINNAKLPIMTALFGLFSWVALLIVSALTSLMPILSGLTQLLFGLSFVGLAIYGFGLLVCSLTYIYDSWDETNANCLYRFGYSAIFLIVIIGGFIGLQLL